MIRCSLAFAAGIAALGSTASCDDHGGAADAAAPAVDATTDAPQVICSPISFAGGPLIAAGASVDLYGVGPGAWIAHAESQAAPGSILYVEAYRDLFAAMSVEVDGFRNWLSECEVCVFLGTGCGFYDIPIGDTGTPAAPTHCESLHMLERGAVALSAFDVDPVSGTFAGSVTPLFGDTSVRLAEVYREGDPSTPTGYGMMVPSGACVEVASLAFGGAWTTEVDDAGVPDAGPTDGGVVDATLQLEAGK